jgi:hypothetical protein
MPTTPLYIKSYKNIMAKSRETASTILPTIVKKVGASFPYGGI